MELVHTKQVLRTYLVEVHAVQLFICGEKWKNAPNLVRVAFRTFPPLSLQTQLKISVGCYDPFVYYNNARVCPVGTCA